MVGMGAFAYITKPFQLEDIEDAVTRAIARHQELTTVPQDGEQSELTTTEES
jgi:DNA-binding NtrC family response regulator